MAGYKQMHSDAFEFLSFISDTKHLCDEEAWYSSGFEYSCLLMPPNILNVDYYVFVLWNLPSSAVAKTTYQVAY